MKDLKPKLNLKQIRTVILAVAALFLVGGIGYYFGSHQFSFDPENQSAKIIIKRDVPTDKQGVNFALFWEVWDRLETSFLEEEAIDHKKMVYGAISGMVGALGDPYTAFLPPQDNKQAKEDLGGSFEGVGIQIGFRNGDLAVIAPLSGMPAEKAGVKAGDLILGIEELSTNGISLPEAVRLIRGPKGTTIKLVLLHEGENEPYEAVITRQTIIVPSVEMEVKDGAAHLSLSRFGDRTNGEWEAAVSEIARECGSNSETCKGVIFDLRNNPGGYLMGSVFITSEFLESGVVVAQEHSNGEKETFSVNRQGKLNEIPLVVLVNKGSASASEIVAGALQEAGRAKIVGETTFGKGSIQEAEDLEGGSGLHITTARWLLPSGKSINKEGVKPDFEIKDDPETETDEQLEKAKEILLGL